MELCLCKCVTCLITLQCLQRMYIFKPQNSRQESKVDHIIRISNLLGNVNVQICMKSTMCKITVGYLFCIDVCKKHNQSDYLLANNLK